MAVPFVRERWPASPAPWRGRELRCDGREQHLAAEVLDGAVGGLVATLPMTIVMLLIHQRLPHAQRYPLEPQILTDKTVRRLGLGKRLGRQQRQTVATLAHFGFGAAAGAAFGPLARWLPLPPVIAGLVYGLVVWAASYAGWVPALGMLNPPNRRPQGRNAMMIAAHLVWGGVLGLFVRRQARYRQRR
jgi:hypothetical protein